MKSKMDRVTLKNATPETKLAMVGNIQMAVTATDADRETCIEYVNGFKTFLDDKFTDTQWGEMLPEEIEMTDDLGLVTYTKTILWKCENSNKDLDEHAIRQLFKTYKTIERAKEQEALAKAKIEKEEALALLTAKTIEEEAKDTEKEEIEKALTEASGTEKRNKKGKKTEAEIVEDIIAE